MIFFKYIKFRNFLSTGNYFTEITLDNSTNTLVVGTNGSGKSTLLDALCFVLFGKPFRGINKPQLCNSINQKDCLVECGFDIGNKKYKIILITIIGKDEINEIFDSVSANLKFNKSYKERTSRLWKINDF